MLTEECDTVGTVALERLNGLLDGKPLEDELASAMVKKASYSYALLEICLRNEFFCQALDYYDRPITWWKWKITQFLHAQRLNAHFRHASSLRIFQ